MIRYLLKCQNDNIPSVLAMEVSNAAPSSEVPSLNLLRSSIIRVVEVVELLVESVSGSGSLMLF